MVPAGSRAPSPRSRAGRRSRGAGSAWRSRRRAVGPNPEPPEFWLSDLVEAVLGRGTPVVVHSSPPSFCVALECCREPTPHGGADPGPWRRERADAPLGAVGRTPRGRLPRQDPAAPAGAVPGRRALAGPDPAGETARRARATVRRRGDEDGQVVPAIAGLLVAVIVLTLAFVALGGEVTAKGRAQRAVDWRRCWPRAR